MNDIFQYFYFQSTFMNDICFPFSKFINFPSYMNTVHRPVGTKYIFSVVLYKNIIGFTFETTIQSERYSILKGISVPKNEEFFEFVNMRFEAIFKTLSPLLIGSLEYFHNYWNCNRIL